MSYTQWLNTVLCLWHTVHTVTKYSIMSYTQWLNTVLCPDTQWLNTVLCPTHSD